MGGAGSAAVSGAGLRGTARACSGGSGGSGGGSDMDAKLAQLKELGELKAQGILDDAEFEAQKDRILNS